MFSLGGQKAAASGDGNSPSTPAKQESDAASKAKKNTKLEVDSQSSWRRSMRVTFQLAKVVVRLGKKFSEPQQCWIAESVYSYKPAGADTSWTLMREYFGTLPFDVDLQPPSDFGIYNDEEKTIEFTDLHNRTRTVRCIYPLRQWKYKVFIAFEKPAKLQYQA
ncbi:hypothetical protein BESB_075020 [Besnoitia besnoiti]|uniref:Uncharacterized protein n=1 Tax=Besnoitia besnoiti TaxID=94643 RepID=A0A2A9MG34_BESBE|nr:uncharacterized protein BESB_075020 [Besnoitia besnoiti]PFH34350.1 hypothetical protein BESB_075020 [Besnoitia besnoiti]